MARTSGSPDSGSRSWRRDPRLDVARGLGMFIILIAHIPSNPWANWIPARFGFSDAAEIFVFCSGLASAIAFGRVFDEAGLLRGSVRIALRIWQVYWAHIGVFVAIVALMAFADGLLGTDRYLRNELNLGAFLDDPGRRLLGLLTLTYVPNYFDILPMYLGILILVPLVLTAERVSLTAAVLLVGGLWVLAALRLLELPADLDTGRPWFFNPFSWQLLFFAGFGLGRGWFRPPGFEPLLVLIALGVIVMAAPVSCHYGFACHAAWGTVPWLGEVHRALFPLIDKTHLGIFRVVHFLSLAYLAYTFVGGRGWILGGWLGMLRLVGRQTLAVFVAGLWIAQALGVLLDVTGRTTMTVTLANVGGCALLVCVAAVVEWVKSPPWSKAPADRAVPESSASVRRLFAESCAAPTTR